MVSRRMLKFYFLFFDYGAQCDSVRALPQRLCAEHPHRVYFHGAVHRHGCWNIDTRLIAYLIVHTTSPYHYYYYYNYYYVYYITDCRSDRGHPVYYGSRCACAACGRRQPTFICMATLVMPFDVGATSPILDYSASHVWMSGNKNITLCVSSPTIEMQSLIVFSSFFLCLRLWYLYRLAYVASISFGS